MAALCAHWQLVPHYMTIAQTHPFPVSNAAVRRAQSRAWSSIRAERINDLARQLDSDYDWLIRKLYGRVPADLGEMFEWTLLLGVSVLPAIDDAADIGPTSI